MAEKHWAEGNPADVLERYLTDQVYGYGEILSDKDEKWLADMRAYCDAPFVKLTDGHYVNRDGKEIFVYGAVLVEDTAWVRQAK